MLHISDRYVSSLDLPVLNKRSDQYNCLFPTTWVAYITYGVHACRPTITNNYQKPQHGLYM